MIARFTTSATLTAAQQRTMIKAIDEVYPGLDKQLRAEWLLSETGVELAWNTDRFGSVAAKELFEHAISQVTDRSIVSPTAGQDFGPQFGPDGS